MFDLHLPKIVCLGVVLMVFVQASSQTKENRVKASRLRPSGTEYEATVNDIVILTMKMKVKGIPSDVTLFGRVERKGDDGLKTVHEIVRDGDARCSLEERYCIDLSRNGKKFSITFKVARIGDEDFGSYQARMMVHGQDGSIKVQGVGKFEIIPEEEDDGCF
ncbi:uncharacterized protein LOC144439857 [Glandiceps talaboti]